MPTVKVHGKTKHFPYTPSGEAAAKVAAKKAGTTPHITAIKSKFTKWKNQGKVKY